MNDPDRNALLAAVLAAPADDLPRLVVADWLDEHGEPERAEFIRVQCELAGCRTCNGDEGPAWDWACGHKKKRAKERNLIASSLGLWSRATNSPPVADFIGSGAFQKHSPGVSLGAVVGRLWHRGFVASVSGPLAAFGEERACSRCRGTGGFEANANEYRCGDCRGTGHVWVPAPAFVELVRREPVERVEVTDRRPLKTQGEELYRWWAVRRVRNCEFWELPAALFDALPHGPARFVREDFHEYDLPMAATAALSAALITLARGARD